MTIVTDHFAALQNMYAAAPINAMYPPVMTIKSGKATISIDVDSRYHHSAGGVHGSVYFKLLDDAAWFAAASLESEYFVLTTSFTTYMTRPVSSGKIYSVGKVVNQNNSQYIAEAVLYDDQERELGRGNGILVPGKMAWHKAAGYA